MLFSPTAGLTFTLVLTDWTWISLTLGHFVPSVLVQWFLNFSLLKTLKLPQNPSVFGVTHS